MNTSDPLGLMADLLIRVEVTDDGCWTWTGATTKNGYGVKSVLTHRLAYELSVGPIPEGLVLDHVGCGNRACMNPEHLEPVTPQENVRRSREGIDACPNGHLYTPENVYKRPGHGRNCRTCRAEAGKRRQR